MIIPYLPQHKNALVYLLQLNTPKHFDSSEKSDFLEYLENHLEDYFTVIENNKIIGCGGINYELKQYIAVISWDIIHPSYQGKGIGKQLLAFRINKIKEDNIAKKIIVRTSQLTYKFYKKGGFALQKVVKDYWANGYDLYEMYIVLNSSK